MLKQYLNINKYHPGPITSSIETDFFVSCFSTKCSNLKIIKNNRLRNKDIT